MASITRSLRPVALLLFSLLLATLAPDLAAARNNAVLFRKGDPPTAPSNCRPHLTARLPAVLYALQRERESSTALTFLSLSRPGIGVRGCCNSACVERVSILCHVVPARQFLSLLLLKSGMRCWVQAGCSGARLQLAAAARPAAAAAAAALLQAHQLQVLVC